MIKLKNKMFIKLNLDWPASHSRQHDGGGEQRPRGGGDRPERVLHQRGVGHPQGPRRETRQGVRLLPWAIPRLISQIVAGATVSIHQISLDGAISYSIHPVAMLIVLMSIIKRLELQGAIAPSLLVSRFARKIYVIPTNVGCETNSNRITRLRTHKHTCSLIYKDLMQHHWIFNFHAFIHSRISFFLFNFFFIHLFIQESTSHPNGSKVAQHAATYSIIFHTKSINIILQSNRSMAIIVF